MSMKLSIRVVGGTEMCIPFPTTSEHTACMPSFRTGALAVFAFPRGRLEAV